MAAIVVVTVSFGLAVAVASTWLALLIRDAETAERVLFFPAIAIAFLSSAFAPIGDLAGWMQPLARANPVSGAADVVRSLAAGGAAASPLILLSCWVAGLILIPGFLAVRRWQLPT
jgi:ABC-type polysaccharide/polyol phosphate export permease